MILPSLVFPGPALPQNIRPSFIVQVPGIVHSFLQYSCFYNDLLTKDAFSFFGFFPFFQLKKCGCQFISGNR
jgi:hypothetical protein